MLPLLEKVMEKKLIMRLKLKQEKIKNSGSKITSGVGLCVRLKQNIEDEQTNHLKSEENL